MVTEHEKADVRYAGMFYLIMAHLGTAFIIVTFLIFYQTTGSFAFEAFRIQGHSLSEGMKSLVFWAALIGFGAKAGIVPLHVWLPYAHPAAPSHVSALMSGVMIKTAIYGLFRVYLDFLPANIHENLPWWFGFTVLVVGTVSALLGVMYALMEHDLKSLLAFHSVENIGIILMDDQDHGYQKSVVQKAKKAYGDSAIIFLNVAQGINGYSQSYQRNGEDEKPGQWIKANRKIQQGNGRGQRGDERFLGYDAHQT